ncbi:MAG: VanZ family protein [Sphingobacteriales bacterium]|nr:VanZ family protein [Sphingobacteriales bacterium]
MWAYLIVFLSVLPSNALPRLSLLDFDFIDKFIHLMFYAVLMAAFIIEHRRFYGKNPSAPLIKKVIAGIFAGGFVIEIIQGAFLQGRQFDVIDLIANGLGISLGLLLLLLPSLQK